MKELIKKLSAIQLKLKAPKGSRNTYGKYNYRTAGAVLEAVKPLLGENILTLDDELVLIGDRYYIKAIATFTNGEFEVNAAGYARESLNKKGMDDSQVTGAASTYARKKALDGLFAIDDSKEDPDSKEVKGGGKEDDVKAIEACISIDELKEVYSKSEFKKDASVIAAKDKQKQIITG